MNVSSPLAPLSGAVLPTAPDTLDKRRVAASFSRAAASYDRAAQLQRDIGQRLMDALPSGFAAEHVLDVGCGTGYFTYRLGQRFPHATLVGLDLAHGMLTHARQYSSAPSGTIWLQGDAERLPLASNSVDLIFSSLAVQWCARLDEFFAEAARVLHPGGWLAVTTLSEQTLHELKDIWHTIDPYMHVNNFLTHTAIEASVARASLQCHLCRHRLHTVYHPTVEALMRDLKAIGARNVNADRAPGLTGRQRLARLREGYEPLRTPAGLPATYHASYLLMRKPLSPSP